MSNSIPSAQRMPIHSPPPSSFNLAPQVSYTKSTGINPTASMNNNHRSNDNIAQPAQVNNTYANRINSSTYNQNKQSMHDSSSDSVPQRSNRWNENERTTNKVYSTHNKNDNQINDSDNRQSRNDRRGNAIGADVNDSSDKLVNVPINTRWHNNERTKQYNSRDNNTNVDSRQSNADNSNSTTSYRYARTDTTQSQLQPPSYDDTLQSEQPSRFARDKLLGGDTRTRTQHTTDTTTRPHKRYDHSDLRSNTRSTVHNNRSRQYHTRHDSSNENDDSEIDRYQVDNSKGQYTKQQLLSYYSSDIPPASELHELFHSYGTVFNPHSSPPVNIKPMDDDELNMRKSGHLYISNRVLYKNPGNRRSVIDSNPTSHTNELTPHHPSVNHTDSGGRWGFVNDSRLSDTNNNEPSKNWRGSAIDPQSTGAASIPVSVTVPASQQSVEFELPDENELLTARWYYKDPKNNTQGPFSSYDMQQWYQQKYFDLKIKIQCNIDQHMNRVFIPLGYWLLNNNRAFLSKLPEVVVNDQHNIPQQQQQQHHHAPPLSQSHQHMLSPQQYTSPVQHFSPAVQSHIEPDDINDLDRYTANLRLDDENHSPLIQQPIHSIPQQQSNFQLPRPQPPQQQSYNQYQPQQQQSRFDQFMSQPQQQSPSYQSQSQSQYPYGVPQPQPPQQQSRIMQQLSPTYQPYQQQQLQPQPQYNAPLPQQQYKPQPTPAAWAQQHTAYNQSSQQQSREISETYDNDTMSQHSNQPDRSIYVPQQPVKQYVQPSPVRAPAPVAQQLQQQQVQPLVQQTKSVTASANRTQPVAQPQSQQPSQPSILAPVYQQQQRQAESVARPAPVVDLDALHEQQQRELADKQRSAKPITPSKQWTNVPSVVQQPTTDLLKIQQFEAEQVKRDSEAAAARELAEQAKRAAESFVKPGSVWGSKPSSATINTSGMSLLQIQQAEEYALQQKRAQEEQQLRELSHAQQQHSTSAWSSIAAGKPTSYNNDTPLYGTNNYSQHPTNVYAQKSSAQPPVVNKPAVSASMSAPVHQPTQSSVAAESLWTDVPIKSTGSASKNKSSTPNKQATATASESNVVSDAFGGGDREMSGEMKQWCAEKLEQITGSSDITLATFLMTVDTDTEIYEYVHSYLGINNAADEFASGFIQQKSFDLSNQTVKKDHTAPSKVNKVDKKKRGKK